MKIVYVIGTSTGGVGTHVRALARDIAAAGHEVGVIGPPETDEHFGFSALPGVRFAALTVGTGIGPGDIASVARLRTLISSFSPEIVHAHGFRAGILCLPAVRSLTGRPRFILSLHNQAGARGLRGRVETGIETLLAKGADVTIGASIDLVERARELGASDARFVPAAAPKVTMVPAEVARATRDRLASELGFDDSAVLILSVGRVAPQKNYPMLVRAIGRLSEHARSSQHTPDSEHTSGSENRPEFVFIVAGAADEDVLAEVRTQYADLITTSAAPALHFLGPRDDIAELGAASDLYVLTSVWEARALVLQEALITGQAIIATKGGGTAELVGDAGILIDSDDDAALAQAITEVATDSELRRGLQERAATRGASLPDEAAVAEELLGIYQELMSAQIG